MQISTLVRSTGVIGVATALALGLSGVSMAATFTNPTSEGNITISTSNTKGNTGTATWTWSQLTSGEYVSVFAAPKNNPSKVAPIATSSGKVTKTGVYSTSVTLPSGDTWQNTDIEMTAAEFAIGGLPEVPWAAALPLLLAIPLVVSLWRRRTAPI